MNDEKVVEVENEVAEVADNEEKPDYQALYEAEKINSRKWEKRAKANLKDADDAKKSAEERIEELERRIIEKEKAEERAKAAARVASEKKVPADLLVGDTEEDMNAWADRLIAAFRSNPAPVVEKPGSFTTAGAKDDKTELREFSKQLLNR